MRKTSGYYISLLVVVLSISLTAGGQTEPPDTLDFPLSIRIGADVVGPVIYFIDHNNLSAEGFISADLNERYGILAGGGYSDYRYSQYNYEYNSKGVFFKAGVDINFLRPEKSMGKYWAGVGLRYGISTFNSEIPSFDFENYWGTLASSIPSSNYIGHYLEASPGFKAEMFRHFTMGWSVNIRRLIYSDAGKDLRPIYFPGFGSGGGKMSFGISYYFVANIQWKKIKVIVKQEEPPAEDETAAQ